MKTKKSSIILFLFSAFLVFFTSCNKNDETEVSSSSHFVSLSFLQNDNIPGIENAVFTLTGNMINNDSIIINVDSLPYQTRIDSVQISINFVSTSEAYLYYSSDSIIDMTAENVFDFTNPVKIENHSADGTSISTYYIKVNVHQINSELYVWEKTSDNIPNAPIGSEQKAIYFKGQFFYYLSNGLNNYLYCSSNPANGWNDSTLIFIPAVNSEVRFRYMVVHDDKLFATTNNNELYTSSNGTSWTQITYNSGSANIYNLLFSLKGNLWAIAQDGNNYSFISSSNGNTWTKKADLPNNFPIGNFSSLVFNSRLGNPKAIVLGGNDKTGEMRKMSWSTENGENWFNLGKEDNALDSIAGATLVQYDDKLFLFGGMDKNNMVSDTYFRESTTQGLSWSIPDTIYNRLPDHYAPRSFQSAVVLEDDKRIYLIGGRDNATTYSDVWAGKKNEMYFEE